MLVRHCSKGHHLPATVSMLPTFQLHSQCNWVCCGRHLLYLPVLIVLSCHFPPCRLAAQLVAVHSLRQRMPGFRGTLLLEHAQKLPAVCLPQESAKQKLHRLRRKMQQHSRAFLLSPASPFMRYELLAPPIRTKSVPRWTRISQTAVALNRPRGFTLTPQLSVLPLLGLAQWCYVGFCT